MIPRVCGFICFVAAVLVALFALDISARIDAALIPAGLAFWLGAVLWETRHV